MGFRDGAGSGLGLRNILNLVLRFLQLIFAITVVGLYAQDLNKARKVDKYSDSRWVQAPIAFRVGGILPS